jgi:hypothetical protein
MPAALVPDALWELIEFLLPPPRPSHEVVARASPTESAFRASFASSEAVFPGGCCRRPWAAAPK